MKKLLLTCLCVLFAGSAAVADWDESMPAKWVQLPDRDPATSLDVYASYEKTLADDFLCTETGLVTEVHIWGSWRQDVFPWGEPGTAGSGDPYAVDFRLSFHEDRPVGHPENPHPYSVPGPLLWEGDFWAGSYDAVEVAQFPEGWYNPNTNEYYPGDHFGMWQYNFYLDAAGIAPFIQQGTATDPQVYWLDVTAFPHGYDETAQWGWKTSRDHWNDDAVYTDFGPDPLPGEWNELVLPWTGESLDMAFVIVPEPATMVLLAMGGLALRRRRRT